MHDIFTHKNALSHILLGGAGKAISRITVGPCVPVLLAMVGLADGNGVVKVGQAELGDILGVSRYTVSKSVGQLQSLGVLQSVSRSVWRILDLDRKWPEATKASSNVAQVNIGDSVWPEATEEGHHSEGDTSYNKLLLRSSSAPARARANTIQEKQEVIRALESVVVDNLGQRVWDQSTNWVDLLNRGHWDMEVITDAIITYKEKVIDEGQRHQFFRLLRFVKTERDITDSKKGNNQGQAYVSVAPKKRGESVSGSGLERLKGMLDV